ncbi:CXXC-type zinc finger protein 1 [Lepeophtheirus salmonis]|uniref:CXXC-type zinc finger protein 1 n=1 Tax=Lepeophtheirus salmonis TaxID=72036 RepID=UPI001AEB877C|nr:CXXC-type zinc finger protein 1-like [Lepeophtheirus salmonis]
MSDLSSRKRVLSSSSSTSSASSTSSPSSSHSTSSSSSSGSSSAGSDDEGKTLYCICQSKSTNGFMIGCDKCEEWYHGTCVKITEGSSKSILKYFCPPCRERNPKLKIKYKKILENDKPPPPSKTNKTQTKESDDDLWTPSQSDAPVKKYPFKESSKTTKNKTIKKKPSSKGESANSKRRKRSNSETSVDESHTSYGVSLKDPNRQCLANCTNTARIGSKYCSDQCGINLASLRIYQTLPDRIREWNLTPCLAEKNNLKELETIHAKQDAIKKRLEELGEEFRELEDLIDTGKKLSIVEKDDDEEDSNEMTIHCVTCGQSVSASSAIRHMERCYNRFESQTSFASKFKTQIFDRRMFCDYYNPKEESYCKRLQVLCPEHNRDPIPSDNEVCGYPIESKLLSNDNVEYCRSAKKRCQQHFSWEKLRRAVIDMERVRQWMKVDELFERERQVRAAMTSRAGVLGLMLHSTYNHELEERWQAQRAAAVAAQQRKITNKSK